jgi:hypothetical protein
LANPSGYQRHQVFAAAIFEHCTVLYSGIRLTRRLRQTRRLWPFIKTCLLPTFRRDRRQSRPIFLMSPASSGSTWIGAMLGHLPSHIFIHEVKLIGDRGLSPLLLLQRMRAIVPGQLLFVLLEAFERAQLWTLDAHIERFRQRRPELLAKENLKALQLCDPSQHQWDYDVIDTAGSQIAIAPLLRKAYPNAILCYIIRDPRDICASIKYRKPFGKFREIDQWAKVVLKEYDRLFKYRDACQIDVLRYEAWLRDAAGELRDFVARHHLEMSPQLQQEAIIQHDAAAMKTGKTAVKGNLQVAQAGSWSKTVSAAERESLKAILSPVLVQFGYETSCDW